MSKIFELFGYPVADQSPEAIETRKNAQCPFMGADCDGGGNRYLSNVNLKQNTELAAFFEGRSSVPSGYVLYNYKLTRRLGLFVQGDCFFWQKVA